MKQYVKSIDSLRIIAILAVVMTHTTTRTLEAAKFNLTGFPMSIFLNQIVRFAVPLFFMISGFVLELNYDQNSGYFAFLKKRFSKIFIPYVFWSAIYYLFIYNQNHDNFLKVILTGNASYQLFFIPALCIFYLIFPFLHRIYKIISNKLFLTLLLISQVYLLYRDYFIKPFTLSDPVYTVIMAYFLFIIGIVAARNKDAINFFVHKWKYILLFMAAVSGIYVFWEGFSRYVASGNYLSYYSKWRPSVLIYTFAVGFVLFHLFEKTKFQFSFTEKLSRLSFLVFLIHVIVLEEAWSFFGKSLFILMTGNIIGKILFDPIFFGIVAGTSFLIAYLLHKIPRIQGIIG
jgi:surface polysaccharide O-acyltransferase-like enzyme